MRATLKGFVKRTKEKVTEQKDMVRRETVKFVCDYFLQKKSQSVHFLTLPSAWWRFEGYITTRFLEAVRRDPKLQNPYIRFIGCERDWTLFQLGCMHMPTRPRAPLKVKTHEMLDCQVVTNSYNYVFLNCDIFEYMRVAEARKRENDHKADCIWLDTTVAITHIDEKLKYLERIMNDEAVVILTVVKAREHKPIPLPRLEYIDSLMKPMGLELIRKFEYNDSTPMLHLIYVKSTTKSIPHEN
jgi:hypothetical protein